MPALAARHRRRPAASRAWRRTQPVQRRAHDTMERFAEAAETLLRERPFERVTVQDIVSEAGRPIGSFYARFSSKEALLPFLYDRYDRSLEPHFQKGLAGVDWSRLDFTATIAALVAMLVASYVERRWLIRALALFARQHPEALTDELVARRQRLYDDVARVLLRHRRRIAHPDPEQAIRFGVFVVSSVARERLLFSGAPHARVTALPASRLCAELSRALQAYLTFRGAAAGRQGRRRARA